MDRVMGDKKAPAGSGGMTYTWQGVRTWRIMPQADAARKWKIAGKEW